jgi:hypothetical protein
MAVCVLVIDTRNQPRKHSTLTDALFRRLCVVCAADQLVRVYRHVNGNPTAIHNVWMSAVVANAMLGGVTCDNIRQSFGGALPALPTPIVVPNFVCASGDVTFGPNAVLPATAGIRFE